MGVLVNSSLISTGMADKGVLADRADNSDGKVAVTGVLSCGSLGLDVGAILSTRCLCVEWIYKVSLVW